MLSRGPSVTAAPGLTLPLDAKTRAGMWVFWDRRGLSSAIAIQARPCHLKHPCAVLEATGPLASSTLSLELPPFSQNSLALGRAAPTMAPRTGSVGKSPLFPIRNIVSSWKSFIQLGGIPAAAGWSGGCAWGMGQAAESGSWKGNCPHAINGAIPQRGTRQGNAAPCWLGTEIGAGESEGNTVLMPLCMGSCPVPCPHASQINLGVLRSLGPSPSPGRQQAGSDSLPRSKNWASSPLQASHTGPMA